MINMIFTLIALPITICVSIICSFFALMFEDSFAEKDGVGLFKRVFRESHNMLLNRFWHDFAPWFQALVAVAIYYFILF